MARLTSFALGGLAGLVGLVVGCQEPGGEALELEGGRLVSPSAWAESEAHGDPLATHRPAEVECPRVGWSVEGESLEVDTGVCNYLLVEQPLLLDVAEGMPIAVDLWHQALHAEEPATGHAALFVGGELLWEREVEIPGPPAIWSDTVEAPFDLRAGDRVVFHLHNHGVNTWNLGEIAAELP